MSRALVFASGFFACLTLFSLLGCQNSQDGLPANQIGEPRGGSEDSGDKASEVRPHNPREGSSVASSDLTVLSIRGASLPLYFFYVIRDNNLYQIWKDNGQWHASWSLCDLREYKDKTIFHIKWQDGSDEIGELASGTYTITTHTGDSTQVGRAHQMERASLPDDARPALNAVIKQSMPLASSDEDLRIANDWLDLAESEHRIKTPRAKNSRELLQRMQQVRTNADLENARRWLETID